MEATRVTIDEVKERIDRGEQFTFVDARNPKAWEEAETKVPGALRVPDEGAEQHFSEVTHERTVITYCTCPHEASAASVAQKSPQTATETSIRYSAAWKRGRRQASHSSPNKW